MLPLPPSIGPYRVLRILGRGGMGLVYLAVDDRLEREVAVKILDDPEASPRARDLLLEEAKTAAAVRHPNIATIYDVGETGDGHPWIAMEYCTGLPLTHLIRRAAVSGRLFLSIARQIAHGVAAAHRAGVVHGDIKSANVILQEDEIVKILDFGLARKFDLMKTAAEARTGAGSSVLGTVPYMAPEQTDGKRGDRRSDLFSVGVVLYELATGRLPFDDESPIELLHCIRDREPAQFEPSDPSFPPAAAPVIARLLQKDPDDRYADADELAADLDAIQSSTGQLPFATAGVQLPPTVPPGSALHAGHRSTVAAFAALVLIALLGAGLWVRNVGGASAEPPPIGSIAVLPLRDLSGNADDSFLAVSLADALTTQLQQIPDLRVRPTSAVLPVSRRQRSTTSAAKELQVDGILDGHYVSDGNRIRVNLQLTDARTGYGVWAATVDGSRGDLLGMMDEVAQRTSRGIGELLGSVPRSRPRSVPRSDNREAYEEFLRARALTGSMQPEVRDQQIRHLQRAIELDPEFAAAYAELAIELSLRQVRGFRDAITDGRTAEWYARQAVRLDPDLPESHLALGRALIRRPDRFTESIRENLAALRLDPQHPRSLATLASFLIGIGEAERAGCVIEQLIRQDPSSFDARTRGYWSLNSVDPAGALAHSGLALQSEDTKLAGHDIRAQAYLILGELDRAEAEGAEARRLAPGHFIGESAAAMAAAAKSDRRTALRRLENFEGDTGGNHWATLRVAMIHARLGDNEQAVEWLGRAYERGNRSWQTLVRHPWLTPLEKEPEYRRIVKAVRADLEDVQGDVIGVYELICGETGIK